jgi:hypothetical protein
MGAFLASTLLEGRLAEWLSPSRLVSEFPSFRSGSG